MANYGRKPFKKSYPARKARKFVRKVGQAVTNRYGLSSKKGLNMGQMAKDLFAVKKLLNVEKKRFEIQLTPTNRALGQVNGNSDSTIFEDITPTPAQGITSFTRNGATIKTLSSYMECQIIQQANTTARINLMLEIFYFPDATTQYNNLGQYYDPNPFVQASDAVSLYDLNSDRNLDRLSTIKRVYMKRISLTPDSVADSTTSKIIKCPIKWNRGKGFHVRFAPVPNETELKRGRLVLVIRADRGNVSSFSSTLSNIPTQAPLTGCLFNYKMTHYFVDN